MKGSLDDYMNFTVLIPAIDEFIKKDYADGLVDIELLVHCELSRSDRSNTTVVAVGAQRLSNSVVKVKQLCAVLAIQLLTG